VTTFSARILAEQLIQAAQKFLLMETMQFRIMFREVSSKREKYLMEKTFTSMILQDCGSPLPTELGE
jgi:hypothetical protein